MYLMIILVIVAVIPDFILRVSRVAQALGSWTLLLGHHILTVSLFES